MPSIDLPPRELAVLRFVLASRLLDIYDDPAELNRYSVRSLARCATALGFDMWDPAAMRAICDTAPTAFEVQRLRKLAGV